MRKWLIRGEASDRTRRAARAAAVFAIGTAAAFGLGAGITMADLPSFDGPLSQPRRAVEEPSAEPVPVPLPPADLRTEADEPPAAGRPELAMLRGHETDGDNIPVVTAAPSALVGKPSLAIVIDDLGANVPGTRAALALPPGVTLSFLPYPDATPELARQGAARGHQILVHVPMQPEGHDDPGPNALLTTLAPTEITRRLAWDLDRVPGFSGVNNHMGSRFTEDRNLLLPVIEMLADRHVFFLDSRTTPHSVVIPLARAFGVASAGRDIFLDDVQTKDAIAAQLAEAAHVAKSTGVAIAIGHPYPATLAVLADWTAHQHDVTLIAADKAIRLKTEKQALASRF